MARVAQLSLGFLLCPRRAISSPPVWRTRPKWGNPPAIVGRCCVSMSCGLLTTKLAASDSWTGVTPKI